MIKNMVRVALLAAMWPSVVGAQVFGTAGSGVESPLYEAIVNADVAAVQRVLQAGADANGAVYQPYDPTQVTTPLGLVLDIWYGEDDAFVEIARVLLRAGADPNVGLCSGPGNRVVMPLDLAARITDGTENNAMAQLLLEAGGFSSSIAWAMARGAASAALHAAVAEGDVTGVQRLLAAGANPDLVVVGAAMAAGRADRLTPLGLALLPEPGPYGESNYDAEMLRALLDAGADPNLPFYDACTDISWTPLETAVASLNHELVELLLAAGADPDGVDVVPLAVAVREGTPELVATLLEAGADPNVGVCLGGFRLSTLTEAAAERAGRTGDNSVVKLLLGKGALAVGAEFAIVRAGAAAALHAAVYHGDVAAVQRLLASGSDPNGIIEGIRGPIGRVDQLTPLRVALDVPGREQDVHDPDRTEVVRLLLAAGADPNRPFPQACAEHAATPLSVAAWGGSADVVRLLLAAGVDPHATGWFEGMAFTPFVLATLSRNSAVMQVLLEAGADPNATLVIGDGRHATELMPLLGMVFFNNSPEDLAELVRILLEAGADPDVTVPVFDDQYATPLLLASQENMPTVVRLLLDSGADPNLAVDIRGESVTPLALALSSESHAVVAALLRAAGAAEPAALPGAGRPAGFEAEFAACAAGASLTSAVVELGVSVRYEIVGPDGDGCRVMMIFESNPNPEWENKPLLLTLDPGRPFMTQMEEGLQSCSMGRDEQFRCAGPLVELLRPR